MTDSFEDPSTPYLKQRRVNQKWSSTGIERKSLHKFLTQYLDPYLITHPPPQPTSIVVLTDSQPLTHQLIDVSNKNNLTNEEIKEILQILHKYDPYTQIFWHPRDTTLGRQADARTRDDHLTPPNLILMKIKQHWKLSILSPFLDMHTLRKIRPFTKTLTDNIIPPENSTPIIFPHPSTSPKQLRNILEFLSLQQIKGILITPKTKLTVHMLPPTIHETLNLGQMNEIPWTYLPKPLQNKRYQLTAIAL